MERAQTARLLRRNQLILVDRLALRHVVRLHMCLGVVIGLVHGRLEDYQSSLAGYIGGVCAACEGREALIATACECAPARQR